MDIVSWYTSHPGSARRTSARFSWAPTDQDAQTLTQATELQARTMPALMEGRSGLGICEIGGGKTLAYVLPMQLPSKSGIMLGQLARWS
jgi:hypothetical protein